MTCVDDDLSFFVRHQMFAVGITNKHDLAIYFEAGWLPFSLLVLFVFSSYLNPLPQSLYPFSSLCATAASDEAVITRSFNI